MVAQTGSRSKPGEPVIFTSTGSDLRWRVELFADLATVQSPIVDTIRIEYDTQLPSDGDLYEIDDACSDGSSIIINGDGQLHNFHKVADFDWIVTPIVQGIDHFVQTSETQENADTTLELHQTCSSGSFAYEDNAFGALCDIKI